MTYTNDTSELDDVLEEIAMSSGFYLDAEFRHIHPEAKAAITAHIRAMAAVGAATTEARHLARERRCLRHEIHY